MKLNRAGVEWGGPDEDWWYFYWWNWLPREYRYWGFQTMWYDGPHKSLGFWFFNWSWTTYWSSEDGWL